MSNRDLLFTVTLVVVLVSAGCMGVADSSSEPDNDPSVTKYKLHDNFSFVQMEFNNGNYQTWVTIYPEDDVVCYGAESGCVQNATLTDKYMGIANRSTSNRNT